MPQMVRRLMQSGIDYFAVANVAEAADIRYMGAGWLISSSAHSSQKKISFLSTTIRPATVSTLEECERLNELGIGYKTEIKVHLKIDTGMGRIGIWHSQAPRLFERIREMPGLQLEGVYTHFSSADSDPDFTQIQRARFLAALDADVPLPDDLLIHADNSAGIDSLSAESPFNAVRIGLLQFGVTPYPNSALGRVNVEPVLSFQTRISLVKDLPAGTDISYGRTHQLAQDSRIAVLTAGYGDGVPLELSNSGYVLIHVRFCPILVVSPWIRLSPITECIKAQIGDCVVLIGKNQDKEISTSEF